MKSSLFYLNQTKTILRNNINIDVEVTIMVQVGFILL